jgi:PAS domain S-box-containing protein
MWDEGQYRIFGVTPETFNVTSANIQALLHPDDVDRFGQAIAAFSTGAHAYEGEFRVSRPDGEVRWCVGTAAATVDQGGRVVRVSGVTVDITERKRAEERQNLLAREVDHRAKNALALAQSIVRLTRADGVKAYVNAVEGRINALARVHTILSLSSWQGAELSKLIDEELAPYSLGGQIKLTGPEVQLLPSTAQTLALALHELFTNSAKYGALSTRSGRLLIGWQVEEDHLSLSWEESGGPLVRTPKSRGFGTRSLLASVESQLGGQAQFDWRAEGLLCRLEVPLTRKTAATTAQDQVDTASSAELQRASG